MTDITLPKLTQTGTNEWADVEDNDKAIRDVVNGDLTNGNLSGSAGITDANLGSPNNSAYRTFVSANGWVDDGEVVGVYLPREGKYLISTAASNTSHGGMIYLAAADYAVAGLTAKLRIRSQVFTNGTAQTVTLTTGLYPLTASSGAAGGIALTPGTVTTGTTSAFASQSANTMASAVTSDISFPTTGHYILGVALSGTTPANSVVQASMQLQVRNV